MLRGGVYPNLSGLALTTHREEGDVKLEAGLGKMKPWAKECQGKSEATRISKRTRILS